MALLQSIRSGGFGKGKWTFFSQSKMDNFLLAREGKSKCAVANGHGSFAAWSGRL